MTDAVAAAKAELDAAIQKYAKALADAAIAAAQPAPSPSPSTIPDAQAGNVLTVKSSTGKTTTTTGTARLAVGSTVTFKNTRTTVITGTEDGITFTTREPSADDAAGIAALANTSLKVDALPKSDAGSSGSAPVAETPVVTTPVVDGPVSLEPTAKLVLRPKGALKALAKAVLGVNHAQSGGGDKLPGKQGTDFGFASEADVKRLAAIGVTRVRISLLWPRVVRTLDGEIDQTYGGLLLNALKLYGKYGISVLVCGAHDYAGYAFGDSAANRTQIGTDKVPLGSLAKMYGKLATFVSADKEARKALYGYDLMNEPINLSVPQVIVNEYQLCIYAIRLVDKTCAIAVEPYPWATTQNFMAYGQALFPLKDPSNLIEIHTHCYFDTDAGGDYAEDDSTINPIQAIDRMKGVIAACKAAGFKHAFGEMGAPAMKRVGDKNVPTPNAIAALANGIAYALASGSDVYAWWWSEYQANDWDNINSITAPRNSDVLAVLQQYL